MEKHLNRIFLAMLLAVLVIVPAGTALWSRQDTTAYYENRALAEFPALTWDSLWDGSFGADFESWYSDHAPGRTTFLKCHTAVNMKLLRRPIVNGIVTAEVLLPFLDFEESPPSAFEESVRPVADRLEKLNAHIKANGGTFLYVGVPEQRTYFEDEFPAYLASHKNEIRSADDIFAKALTDRGVSFLDMRQVYADLGHPAELYSAVDHHYNYYGAYAAYRTILDRLNGDGFRLPVLTEEMLEFRELPNPYLGSRNRKLYNLWPNTERAVIGVQKNPIAFTRMDNGQLSDKPLFVLPEDTAMPATYGLYMGGDIGETILETEQSGLPDVLIFGDSFTNAIETLLYASFHKTYALDLRHYKAMSLKDYISKYKPDIVLCVLNNTFYYTSTGNGAVWEDQP